MKSIAERIADMVVFPHAKINIGLYITEKRADGYHNIETIFYPLQWCDALEVLPSTHFSFVSYGLPILGDSSQNLCVKAWNLLHEQHHIPPVSMHLLKQIPMGAGLGGGSADGAYTLRVLQELFQLHLSAETLQQYALALGSDCPFFIESKPVFATGRGEQFQPISLPPLENMRFFVVHPHIHLSTPWAFSQVQPTPTNQSLPALAAKPIAEWKECIQNQFERPAIQAYPVIGEIIQTLYQKGAVYAAMTGSGSTVYGIFPCDASPTFSFPDSWPQRWIA
jgi:4-diphosphocytidyl-2-C-methyl-D-erythritol kinase